MRFCPPGLRHSRRCICTCLHCINVNNKFFKVVRSVCLCVLLARKQWSWLPSVIAPCSWSCCLLQVAEERLTAEFLLSLTPFLHITHVVISCSPTKGLQAMQWLLLWIFPCELFQPALATATELLWARWHDPVAQSPPPPEDSDLDCDLRLAL